MKKLTETLKKEQIAKNSDYQRQMYKKYCLERERKKRYVEATNELYKILSDLSKKLTFK